MNKSVLAILALLIALLSGCASTSPATPEWISGDSAQYKNSEYLIGRGQAATAEEAKDRARADLSKIFQVSVVSESEDIQQFRSNLGEGKPEYEGEATRRISTRTEQIIHGIQIAELWQDADHQLFHALAIMPRLQTAASLRQQIDQLDTATISHIEQSRNQNDLFLKIAAANQAFETQRERTALQKSLQIVDITGRGIDEKWNSGKLKNDLDELLKRVRITYQVTAESMPGLENVVSGALAQSGFMIETGQNPDFVLQAGMQLNDLGLKDGWYWQRGVLEVTLSEKTTNRVRGAKRWNIKGNAPDRESAAKRALNQADRVLKQELRAAIIDMATTR